MPYDQSMNASNSTNNAQNKQRELRQWWDDLQFKAISYSIIKRLISDQINKYTNIKAEPFNQFW